MGPKSSTIFVLSKFSVLGGVYCIALYCIVIVCFVLCRAVVSVWWHLPHPPYNNGAYSHHSPHRGDTPGDGEGADGSNGDDNHGDKAGVWCC